MSPRLLVMLIFIIIRLKVNFMLNFSSLNHIEDCFYEKRFDTSLNGYNDLHDHWISELDCLERCLRLKPQRCRSFEHWRSHRHGLCVRANISLSEHPSSIGTNLFVDYYEIDCRQDTKAVRLQTTSCPGDQLNIFVALNAVIHLPSEMDTSSTFYYSFYLYNILKEPIPFQIQCQILDHEEHPSVNHTGCSQLALVDNNDLSIIKDDKRHYSYILFRSSPVYVTRQLPLSFFEQDKSNAPSNYFNK
ncbi:unnamed protein product [Rotaria magnacalcarata]|uniref:Apple domain-containing protein n=1 Tax=Rotaria magnacalcarata TaxID=392030 RepID=A0A8S2PEH5_9BILA|nr:unnamed protein product [Rotaria magnacalcarata]